MFGAFSHPYAVITQLRIIIEHATALPRFDGSQASVFDVRFHIHIKQDTRSKGLQSHQIFDALCQPARREGKRRMTAMQKKKMLT